MSTKKTAVSLVVCLGLISLSCKDAKKTDTAEKIVAVSEMNLPKITFAHDTINKKVAVKIDGELFTSYLYDGQTPKPILYPIIAKNGATITRGFPYSPRPNERVDHPHHAGLWFNYGDVNGLDFWNNSYAISEEDKHKYGTILHSELVNTNEEEGTLTIKALWRAPDQTDLLEETTIFTFSEDENTRIIDRNSILKALEDVSFKDNKEGMLGLRTARELELPSDKPAVFTDTQGIVTEVKALNNDGVSGDYLASDGTTGLDVWGTRNNWVQLHGTIADEAVSITIMDNKNNVGFPTYWHARGYGLFAANPLGQEVFSEGKEVLNFELNKTASATFNYRIVIHSGSVLSEEKITQLYQDFNQ
ncbi:MAG: hypothetical protein COA50_06915 [Flavobacteriaceae bacterium]|nr:MAG: hypothetical protein COA50_06915 [Flavobacteriaceae bacterium]